MNRGKRTVILIITIAILLSFIPMLNLGTIVAEIGDHSRIIVSLGDSYSAGEGIPPFYDQEKPDNIKEGKPDWVAHRSKSAWSGRLQLPNISKPMSELRGRNWFFVAASGAKTENLLNQQAIEINRNATIGTHWLDPQLDVFNQLGEGQFADYVTVTIGGNDADFTDVITTSALSNRYLFPTALYVKVIDVWNRFYEKDGIRSNLKKAYKDIQKAAGDQAAILVVGYPELLSYTNRFLFDPAEVLFINSQVRRFNRKIEEIVNECREDGMYIRFVSVEEAFKNHEAYSLSPYIHPVMFTQSEDVDQSKPTSSYSIHPNEKGAQAYAECVQREINLLEDTGANEEIPLETKSIRNEIGSPVDIRKGNAQSAAKALNEAVLPASDQADADVWDYLDVDSETVVITNYRGNAADVVIPEVLAGKKVIRIGESAFAQKDFIKSVTIPDTVTSVSAYAFDNDVALTSVVLPDSLLKIREYAFRNCTALSDITIPRNVTILGKGAFSSCTSLRKVTILGELTNLEDYTFESCESLTEITLPDSLASIGECAFWGCSSLVNCNIPTNVTTIEKKAFGMCSSLKEIDLPEGLTTIEYSAFRECTSLASITLPAHLKKIEDAAFMSCFTLEKAAILCNISDQFMGQGIFSYCKALKDISFAENVETIGPAMFAYCDALEDVFIPDGMKTIEGMAFSNCKNLTKVRIPDSVEYIAYNSFEDCDNITIFVGRNSYAAQYLTGEDLVSKVAIEYDH